MSYLRLLNSPPLAYVDLVLHQFEAQPVLPYSSADWFASFASQSKYCATNDALQVVGVECSLFLNYGNNLTLLFVQLIISSIVSISVAVIFNTLLKEVHNNKVRRTGSWLTKSVLF